MSKKRFKSKELQVELRQELETGEKTKEKNTGAIATDSILVIEIYFSISGVQNVAWMFVDILAKRGEDNVLS